MVPPAARALFASLIAVALGAFGARAKETGMPTFDLLPVPAEIAPAEGRLAIDAGFRVALAGYGEPRLERAALRFLRRLVARTGIPLPQVLSKEKGTLTVRCERAGEAVQSPAEDESYVLEIRSGSAELRSVTPVGALRGMETFLQLVAAGRDGHAAPALTIKDRPRFPWRGLMIDACRHWQPLDVIKRNLDGMASVKLNVLHWHLTEDQGFRVESKRYPRLHGMGSEGNFYSQEDVRDILEYARERGIRVVAEFDMPGHTGSWFVGHPELASARGPFALERKYGINDHCMDPSREALYAFLDGFIGEMAALFPDAYLHIGGDEVNGRIWNTNPSILAFKRKHGMESNHDLQAYFNSRLLPIVQKHGKKMVGWDEILHPNLPKSSLIHSWRGQDSLARAAREGYSGILSFGYYLDLAHPASAHYAVDPLDKEASKLSPEEQSRILGGEACMWSEWVTADNIDSRIWPRAAAVAERLWSPRGTRDAADMYRRLELVARQLEWLGLTHRTGPRRMLARLAGSEAVEPLEVLARVLEPVKDYARSQARSYTSLTPLNRLVDAVQPESDQGRAFNADVEQALAGGKEAEAARAAVRESLLLWNGNHARLEPMLRGSFLLAEAAPLSSDLSSAAALGLAALEASFAGKLPGASWKQDSLALLDRARKPRAEVSLVVLSGIRKLVGAVPESVGRSR
jgi:hexosaminidase